MGHLMVEEMNRHAPQEDIWIVNSHTKKCSLSNTKNNEVWSHTDEYVLCWKDLERKCLGNAILRKKTTQTLIYCWWECCLIHTLWKAIWKFVKKSKTTIFKE